MQQLLGDHLGPAADNNSFLKELFLQRLPPNVRMVLASADEKTDLAKLADMADKIIEVTANAYYFSFVPHIISLWNSLDSCHVNAQSLCEFKSFF